MSHSILILLVFGLSWYWGITADHDVWKPCLSTALVLSLYAIISFLVREYSWKKQLVILLASLPILSVVCVQSGLLIREAVKKKGIDQVQSEWKTGRSVALALSGYPLIIEEPKKFIKGVSHGLKYGRVNGVTKEQAWKDVIDSAYLIVPIPIVLIIIFARRIVMLCKKDGRQPALA